MRSAFNEFSFLQACSEPVYQCKSTRVRTLGNPGDRNREDRLEFSLQAGKFIIGVDYLKEKLVKLNMKWQPESREIGSKSQKTGCLFAYHYISIAKFGIRRYDNTL
jgi:hypothetical protein